MAYLDNENEVGFDDLKKLVLGKKIKGVRYGSCIGDSDFLILENGFELELFESAQDCCANAHGEWELLNGDDLEAGITDMEIVNYQEFIDDDFDTPCSTCELHILHNQNLLAKGECYANSGNGGFYFSVLSLKVIMPNEDAVSAVILSS